MILLKEKSQGRKPGTNQNRPQGRFFLHKKRPN
jgi:hypothetical protein